DPPRFEPQPGEIVALEHWGSSGFANTDLDLQLKKHGIHQLIVTGLIAHTCVEATGRYAAELGYEVNGKRRDRGLLGCRDARCSGRQYPKLCQCHCNHK